MTVCLFHCWVLSQYLKKLYKSISIGKRNLKVCTITDTKKSDICHWVFSTKLWKRKHLSCFLQLNFRNFILKIWHISRAFYIKCISLLQSNYHLKKKVWYKFPRASRFILLISKIRDVNTQPKLLENKIT